MSKFLEVKSGNFRLKGVVSNGDIPAIVIGSHKYYPRTFSDKFSNELKLTCIDTRGFTTDNALQTEADFSLEHIIQDVESFRKELKADKVIVVGHSIHAFMAMEYAKKFPKHVSHLVLIASSPISGPKLYNEADQYFKELASQKRKDMFFKNMQDFMKKAQPSFVERMLAFGPMLWYDYDFDASKLWEDVEINTLGSSIIWGSLFEGYEVATALNAVQCPILLVLGKHDYFNPPHLWEAYRHYAKDLTIEIFEKSGHTPQLEAKEFDAVVLNWLSATL